MFVTKEKNRQLAMDFWNGKPSGNLFWGLDAGKIDVLSRERGFADCIEYFHRELGCLVWANIVAVAEMVNPAVEIVETRENTSVLRSYKHRAGVLSEKLVDGQIVEPKVKTPGDLAVLRAMWEGLDVTPKLDQFQQMRDRCAAEMPVVAYPVGASAVQQMLQYETGVVNFWYLAEDCPELLEEVMAMYQNMKRRQYAIMKQVECDGYYQAENTSTTMISPSYYNRWGAPQVREFTTAAHEAGKRAMVHMCGLLKGLMPRFAEIGIDIIHALTPPQVGNMPFEEAIGQMPASFGMLGRFGSLEWIGKSQTQIEENLRRILPHNIYMEHPFILLVTADGADYTAEDLSRVRDAVEVYERS